METLGKFTMTIIVMVISFFVVLLSTYILRSVATLYELTFITNLSFIQVFGLLGLLNTIRYKYKKPEETREKKDYGETLTESFIALFTTILAWLISWGMLFISHYILS